MGGVLTCVDAIPEVQRLEYDLTPIKLNPVPMLWLLGPPGSGRTTQGLALSENTDYEYIKIADILKEESTMETDRGATVKEALNSNGKKIPDELVVDLIKEKMLQAAETAKGYILNGFPRTEKQGALFVKEIGDVDVVVYLSAEIDVMVTRTLQKRGSRITEVDIRNDIANYTKEVKNGISRFSSKMEKIYTHAPAGDVLGQIEAAVNIRLNISPSTVSMRTTQLPGNNQEQSSIDG